MPFASAGPACAAVGTCAGTFTHAREQRSGLSTVKRASAAQRHSTARATRCRPTTRCCIASHGVGRIDLCRSHSEIHITIWTHNRPTRTHRPTPSIPSHGCGRTPAPYAYGYRGNLTWRPIRAPQQAQGMDRLGMHTARESRRMKTAARSAARYGAKRDRGVRSRSMPGGMPQPVMLALARCDSPAAPLAVESHASETD